MFYVWVTFSDASMIDFFFAQSIIFPNASYNWLLDSQCLFSKNQTSNVGENLIKKISVLKKPISICAYVL